MSSRLTCDTAPPPCLCPETQQCITISRSRTECQKNVCRDTAGAGGGGGGGGGTNGGAIGGAVGGVIVALCLFGWLYWYFKKRESRRGPIGLSRGSRKGLKNLSIGGNLYHGRRATGEQEKYGGRESTEFDSVIGTGGRTEKATTTSRMMNSDRATRRSSTGLSLGTTAGARDGHSEDDHQRARKRGSAVLVEMPPSDSDGEEREKGARGKKGSADDPFGDHHSSVAYSERMSVATSKAADVIPIAYIPSHSSTSAVPLPTSRPTASSSPYSPISPSHLSPTTPNSASSTKRGPSGPSPLSRSSAAVPNIGIVAPSNASEASRLSLPVSELSSASYDDETEEMSAQRHSGGSAHSGGGGGRKGGEEGDGVVISHVQRVDLSSPKATSLARSGSINDLRRQNSQGHTGVTADGRPIRPPRAPGLDLKLPDQPPPAHAITSPPVGGASPLDGDRPASGFPWGTAATGSSTNKSTPTSGLRTGGAAASTPSAFGPEGARSPPPDPQSAAAFSRFSASTIASNANDGRPVSTASSWVDDALSPGGLRPKDSRYYSRMSDVSAAPSHMSYNIMDPATIVTPMTGAARVQLGGRTEVGRVVQLGRSPSGKRSNGDDNAREELEGDEGANPFADNKRASDAASVAEVHIASRVQRSPGAGAKSSPAYIDLVGGGGKGPSPAGSRPESYGTADGSSSSRPGSTGYAASASVAPTSPTSGRHQSLYSEAETSADRTSYAGSLGAPDGEFTTPTTPSFPMPPVRTSPAPSTRGAAAADEPNEGESTNAKQQGKEQQSLGPSRAVSQAYSMRSGYSSGGVGLEGIPFNLAFPSGVEGSNGGGSDRGSVWSVASKAPHKHGHAASSSVSSKRTQAHLSVPMTVVSHFDDDEEEERRRVIRGDDEDVPPVPAIPPVPKLPHQGQSQAVHIIGSPKSDDKKEELMPLPEVERGQENKEGKEGKGSETTLAAAEEKRTASGASVRGSADSFMLMAGLAAQFADGE